MTKRTICIITGSRAEYGLLRWLMEAIRDDERLSLQITVTGMHLEPPFGETWREITDDKFQIDARIPMHMEGDSPADISAAMGCIIKGMGEALADLRPDIVVVLGDRFEILAAILAAQPARIPVAHIHGGELTEGAMDDGMRHAITKLSHLHFTAADAYARRVVQVGEDPSRVFQVGGLGIEAITHTDYLDEQALERDLGHSLSGRLLLITCHPETLALNNGDQAVTRTLLAALAARPETRAIFTGVNADPGRQATYGLIHAFVADHPGRAHYHVSLGQRRYLSLMRIADAVVGNSSSGLLEAPAMGVPTVNIGGRQAGRLRAPSVIDCPEDAAAICAALDRALDADFRRTLDPADSPYGSGTAAAQITKLLATVSIDGITRKRFYDQPVAA
jgi:GDP/UDP-N,N'-diacetylbacillosamine 2-epimerase (hydrolysing)